MNPSWQRKRLKYVCSINPSKSEVQLPDDAEVTFVPMERATEDGTVHTTERRRLSEVYQGFTYFRDGDVLVAKITPCFENGKGGRCIGLTSSVGFGSTEFHVLRAREGTDSSFLFYITRTSDFRGMGEKAMYGAAGQQRVPEDFLQNWVVALPPLQEQRVIAGFLDRKTVEIDAIVARKERIIELLREERQALVSRALTRGQDAGAVMKDSGIAWLGNIPGHWRTAKIAHYARVTNGCTPSRIRPDYWDGDIPWLSSGKVNDCLIESASEWITATALHECPLSVIPKGTVVVGMIGQGRTRGTSARLGIDACINQNMAAIIPRPSLSDRFLHHVLTHAYTELRELGRGGNQEAINCELLSSFRVPLPPLPEQQAICAHIDRETSRIDGLIGKNEQQIAKLREYRQALISAAVVGKMAVPPAGAT